MSRDHMAPETRRRVSAAGGRMVHELGFSTQWTRETARAAALKRWAARRSAVPHGVRGDGNG